MYEKEAFKQRFRNLETRDLIANSLRGLSEEALQATREILAERGIEGHALEQEVSDTRRDVLARTSVTNQCDYCGKTTAGAVRRGPQKFCGPGCAEECMLLERSVDLAHDLIHEHAVALRFGPCPKCRARGDIVEVRPAYTILSVVVITRYATEVELCCRRCGRGNNVTASIWSFVMGWWSLPGLFSTPFVIGRNLVRAFKPDHATMPSVALLLRARLDLARRMPSIQDVLADLGATGS